MEIKGRPIFAVFGGTFDPVHTGHVGLVRGLLQRGSAERVLVIPTARNPFKGRDQLLPAPLRLAMVRRALRGIGGASVLELEMRRGQPSYTVDTVSALASMFPRARLKLAVGWDVYLQFPEWRNAPEILEQVGLLVVLRKGEAPPAPAGSKGPPAGLPPEWRARVRRTGQGIWRDEGGRRVLEFVNLDLPGVSSSGIRRTRALRDVPEGAREMLAEHWRREKASR